MNGYDTEDSESDFVDVKDIEKWKDGKERKDSTSKKNEICVDGLPISLPNTLNVNVQRSQTARSSLKSPLVRLKGEESVKRRISFDLHDTKAQVTIQPSNHENQRHLFTPSRWSTSSSEPGTPSKSLGDRDEADTSDKMMTSPPIKESSDIITNQRKESLTENSEKNAEGEQAVETQPLREKKIISLKTEPSKRRSVDVIAKRRHSTGGTAKAQGTALRDSAIDLISDEENSEVYTAISLAGTLKRNAQPIESGGLNKKWVFIGVVGGALTAVTIIIILAVLLAAKKE